MIYDIKNIFHFIILFQCLFFSWFLVTKRKEKKNSNLILIAFLSSIIIVQIGGIGIYFIELRNFLYNFPPQFYYLIFPFRYLFIPILYLRDLLGIPLILNLVAKQVICLLVLRCLLGIIAKFKWVSGTNVSFKYDVIRYK